jgi:hypothetical protein
LAGWDSSALFYVRPLLGSTSATLLFIDRASHGAVLLMIRQAFEYFSTGRALLRHDEIIDNVVSDGLSEGQESYASPRSGSCRVESALQRIKRDTNAPMWLHLCFPFSHHLEYASLSLSSTYLLKTAL